MSAYPNVSLDWLMKGIGVMFHDSPNITPHQVLEEMGEYKEIKSPINAPRDMLPDDEKMKETISSNLRTAGKRWKLSQVALMELLGGAVGRQGRSTYFRGDTLPRLHLLLRLERFTGWPLVVLSTRALNFDEIPPAPLIEAPTIPSKISPAELAELKSELHRLRLRLGRIIEQIES